MKYKNKSKHATAKNGKFIIRFPFNSETLSKVKSISGRKFIPAKKYWVCPINEHTATQLRTFGFELLGLTQSDLDVLVGQPAHVDYPIIQIPKLKRDIYEFQNRGVSFLQQNLGRGLIADEMGLGKTIQAVVWLHLNRKKLKHSIIIIVCPASVKLNWKRELKKWNKYYSVALVEGKKSTDLPDADIYIINYDILSGWVQHFKTYYTVSTIITDECHYYKNSSAARTKAVKKLAKGVPYFIALSGTPIINRPEEIFNAIHIINPSTFPNFWNYAQRYCDATNNGWGWDFSGASNVRELHDLLISSRTMIRRKKNDVLKELPDKIRSFIPLPLSNTNEYNKADKYFLEYVREVKGKKAAKRASAAEVLTQIEVLKQVAIHGKLDKAIEWIKDFRETGEKLVIFTIHKFVIDRLMEEFKRYAVKVDGSLSGKQKDKAVLSFQNDPKCTIFVGNIKAAGVGLTLTAASSVAFLELPWTPGELAQAEDRIHRIGQKNACCIYYLLSQDTIEEKLGMILDQKLTLLNNVLDGIDPEDDALFDNLLNEYIE